MRIRCKPWAKPELEQCPFYITDPTTIREKWENEFPNTAPLRLELGCGKGGFISQEAVQNPDRNYVALDIKNEMLVLAKRKIETAYSEQGKSPENIRIAIANIMYLREIFGSADRVERIYINFCNPWSHTQHKKRRLTHPRQLVQYRQILDGDLWFKTDDDNLFEESIHYLKETGFQIQKISYDLHSEPEWMYTQTEHEAMFEEEGKTIKFLIAAPDKSIPEERFADILKYSERNPLS